MAIWHSGLPLDDANRRGRGCAVGHLGIELVEAGDDWLKARMPVDDRTRQPAKFHCVGQEINANHIRAVTDGWVYGVARPIHLGRSSQVWDVRIHDEEEKLVSIARVTMAVLATPNRY